MSNGAAGIGSIDIKQDEGAYHFEVGEAWSSCDYWATLHIDLDDKQVAYLDFDFDKARELAALLLKAAGNADLAEAIPADMAKREAAQRIQQEAADKMLAARVAADKAFNDATRAQQAEHKAAIQEAERLYAEAAGHRLSRSIIIDGELEEMPF